jgi:hypothetical protein
VHLRVAPPDDGPRLTIFRRNLSLRSRPIPLVLAACCVAACGRPAPARDLKFESTFAPMPVSVGTTRFQLRVFDAAGRPVRGARLQVQAQMSHPGMAPLVVTAAERGEGLYEAELQFSMGGDWILVVEGFLPNGDRVHHRIDVPDVRDA